MRGRTNPKPVRTAADRARDLKLWAWGCTPDKLDEATVDGLAARHGVKRDVAAATLFEARKGRGRPA